MKLELFKKETCPYCRKVLQHIAESGRTDIELKDIVENEENRKRLVDEGGKQQVPCLFIDGRPLYESGDIIEWLKENPEHADCAYCSEGALLDAFGIKIGELPMSKVILFREQSHWGRVIVACRKHVDDITDLSEEDRIAFIQDVNHVAEVIHEVFRPDKINFGAYGDTMHHLHFHLVPKYNGGFEWGGVFTMNPKKHFLTEDKYEEMIEQIRTKL